MRRFEESQKAGQKDQALPDKGKCPDSILRPLPEEDGEND